MCPRHRGVIRASLQPPRTVGYSHLPPPPNQPANAPRLFQVPIFLKKAIELYEMVCVRHGLMVVGPTGGGKSSNIKVLKEALTHLKVP